MKDKTKITIDPELQSLLEPLTSTEYEQLEQNIIDDGCRDPLVLWNDVLVDGHNRYKICQEHDIPFKTINVEFDSKIDCKIWMIKNQFGKRNWTTYTASTKALELKELIAEKNKKKQLACLKKGDVAPVVQNSAQRDKPTKTRDELANLAGVSHDTINKVEYINKNADKETKEKLKKKDVSIDKVFKQLKNVEYKKKEAEKKDVSEVKVTSDLIKGLFNCDILKSPIEDNSIDVIITDPPYPKEYLDCWTKLAEFAVKKLKKNGLLIAMSGQSYLPEVFQNMKIEGLNYYWTGCIKHMVGTDLWAVRFRTMWKPLLFYVKGSYGDRTFQGTDVFESEYKEHTEGQEYHKWGQSIPLFEQFVDKFTYKDNLICDPFLGGGTTAIACINKKRKFVGIELDKETFKIAEERIAIHIKPIQ